MNDKITTANRFSDLNDPAIHFVLGHPIAHSISPLIYNTLYKKFHMNCTCVKSDVHAENLGEFLNLRNNFRISAINLTIPHKASVIKYLDTVENSAMIQNSVNSVVVRDGMLHGTSTDGEGFSLALREYGEHMKNKAVFIYGAGGAAYAIAHQAAKDGAQSLYIYSRNIQNSENLCSSVSAHYDIICNPVIESDFLQIASLCDAFVNCSPLGMKGTSFDFEDLGFLATLKKKAFVCDIVYNPSETKLLTAAKSLGIKSIGGIGMLVWQALVAFNFFYDLGVGQTEKDLIQSALKKYGFEF